jgi:hypothetical protein
VYHSITALKRKGNAKMVFKKVTLV